MDGIDDERHRGQLGEAILRAVSKHGIPKAQPYKGTKVVAVTVRPMVLEGDLLAKMRSDAPASAFHTYGELVDRSDEALQLWVMHPRLRMRAQLDLSSLGPQERDVPIALFWKELYEPEVDESA